MAEAGIRAAGGVWERVSRTVAAQAALVAAVFVIAAALSMHLLGRQSAPSLHRSRPFGVDIGGADPDVLEREAAAAERAGDLDRAVRLQFVAGVLRLDRAGVISYRSSMTTGQLRAYGRRTGVGAIPSRWRWAAAGGFLAGGVDVVLRPAPRAARRRGAPGTAAPPGLRRGMARRPGPHEAT